MPVETIVVGKPFEYTPDQITLGIARVRTDLENYKNLLQHSDAALRDAAVQVVPLYEATLAFAQTKRPDQMIDELHSLYQAIEQLEKEPRTEAEIEDYLYDHWRIPVLCYRDILNRGWIETAFQRVVTASMRRD